MNSIHRRGWCQGTGGNFSVVVRGDPLELLITRSGRDKGALDPEADLVRVDRAGAPLPGLEGADQHMQPSAETLLHCVIAERMGARAVLHTHSVFGTLLSERFAGDGGFRITGYEMLKGLRGVTTHEAEVFVPVLANTQDMPALRDRLAARFAREPAGYTPPGFLLAGHGLYAWGDSLAEARRHVEIFEFLFEVCGRRTAFAPFLG